MFEIVKRRELANGTIILNEIIAPLIAKKAMAGQFVILKSHELGERIPLTIADMDVSAGTITVIYMVVGRSTSLFKAMKCGERYQDVTGPLGSPTCIEKVGKVLCVGGGTGVAVLHPIARELRMVGNLVTCVIGSRTKELLILEDHMKVVSDNLVVCTDDGSYGHHGFVTDIVKGFLEKNGFKLVVAIGPVPMMKAVSKLTQCFGVKTLVSLNPIMVDGTGMCGGCRVTVGGKVKFACVDGPEFDGHEVDFDELILRLQSYKEYENRICS